MPQEVVLQAMPSTSRYSSTHTSRAFTWIILVTALSIPSIQSFTFPAHGISHKPLFSPTLRSSNFPKTSFPLYETANDPTPAVPVPEKLVAETSLRLKRVSWLSWWCQMILTVTSSIILIFAKNVVAGVGDVQVNLFLAGTGILASFMSIFWTWGGGARLSRRLLRRPTSKIQAAKMLRKAIDVGVSLNLIGMFLTLLGAEQTVGVLAIKVLTARPWNNASPFGAPFDASLQPLDILVVQANTNALLSHFCSLVSLLYLTRYVKKLDPPSVEEEVLAKSK